MTFAPQTWAAHSVGSWASTTVISEAIGGPPGGGGWGSALVASASSLPHRLFSGHRWEGPLDSPELKGPTLLCILHACQACLQ